MGSFDVQIVGGQELTEFGRRFRAAPKKAQAATRRQLNAVIKPLQKDILAEVVPAMPKGYEQVFAKSLQFRMSLKTTYWAAITLTTAARGKTSRGRKIERINEGILRHPVHGRFRVSHKTRQFIENPWVDQPVKPGFWSRPVREGKPKVQRELSKVIVDSLRDAVKG